MGYILDATDSMSVTNLPLYWKVFRLTEKNVYFVRSVQGMSVLSYDLHITKADHWTDSESRPITSDDISKISEILESYQEIPFFFQRGRITLCGADERVIGLMIVIAERIGGRVQGDEGEFYDNTNGRYAPSPYSLRGETQPSHPYAPSAVIGTDGSIHLSSSRSTKEEDPKRLEVVSRIHGKSDNWEADLIHWGSGKVTWKLTYLGDEPEVKSFIFDITSNHSRSKGNARRKSRTEGIAYEWTTYLGRSGSLAEETIALKIQWNGREEYIALPAANNTSDGPSS